VSLFKKNCQR